MMSFLSHKPKDTLALIIDIQSSVVRGTLVYRHASELPRIAWTSTIPIPYRPDEGSSYLVDSAVKAIEDISTTASAFAHDASAKGTLSVHISRVHCVLSSPWIVSQARTVLQKFEKETRITKTFVKDIIDKERASMKASGNDTMMAIEEKIFDVRLNGYSVAEWDNNKGKTFEVSFAISLAGKSTISRFTESCKRAGVSEHQIDFHSSLLLQHMAIDNTLSVSDPHILIHVHGELTDIVISTGETCILFGSHPTGVRTIIRQLMQKRSISESAVDSLITLHETEQLDSTHGEEDAKSLGEVFGEWMKKSTEIISLAGAIYQPARIIISARFHEILFKNTVSLAYPAVKTEILPTDELFSLVTFNPEAEKLRLTILYLSAIHSLETF
jgi:hypothetical protein